MDLSFNFFERLPMDGLKNLKNLKFLNLGSNKIKVRDTRSHISQLFFQRTNKF